ncbi:hypothetical protein [Amphibacillus cookii]|uniref:hypothetical protein n=1 Tax=Amphibacillus cookii TaxID=767787 RepID=UPI00195C0B8D|nr:hypothetical protein [Amphibacillus cookii]MBM7542333.1 hypothetical protein [Amphibacillus cookii]
MANFKSILLCAQINIKKWLVNPRIYTIFIATFAFLFYHTYALTRFAAEVGHAVTPWVFPHLFTSPVLQVFAFLIVLLFCDAPFKDHHTPFVTMRTGRKNWIIGQLIYLMLASFIFTVFTFITSIIVLLPHLQVSLEWGIVMESLANDPAIASDRVTIFFNPELLNRLSPLAAAGFGLLYFYLVTLFIGSVILCFNVLLQRTAGIVVAGILIAVSLFANYLGFFSFGYLIYYLSPISWMSISTLDWGSGQLPSLSYTLSTLVIAMVLLSIIATCVFIHKDMELKEGGL